MKEKELKRLSRAELLELLLVQTKETDRLQTKLEQVEKELSDRQLRVQEAGSLAQAVVEINGVMTAAQAAAQQYLDNIARMEKETKQHCERMLADAKKEAHRQYEKILADAREESVQIHRSNAAPATQEDVLIGEIYELLGEKK